MKQNVQIKSKRHMQKVEVFLWVTVKQAVEISILD